VIYDKDSRRIVKTIFDECVSSQNIPDETYTHKIITNDRDYFNFLKVYVKSIPEDNISHRLDVKFEIRRLAEKIEESERKVRCEQREQIMRERDEKILKRREQLKHKNIIVDDRPYMVITSTTRRIFDAYNESIEDKFD
jgi:hypothetical protein